MEKVYVLTERTNDAGRFDDRIVGIFNNFEEVNTIKSKLESKMEEMCYGDDVWLEINEYAIGLVNPIYLWYEDFLVNECGLKKIEYD